MVSLNALCIVHHEHSNDIAMPLDFLFCQKPDLIVGSECASFLLVGTGPPVFTAPLIIQLLGEYTIPNVYPSAKKASPTQDEPS